MRIGIAQINTCVNNVVFNKDKIISMLEKAGNENIDLCVFPELSLTGYPLTDASFSSGFLNVVQVHLESLAQNSGNMWFIVGAPHKTSSAIYNAAYVMGEGKIQHIAHKSLLPNYDVFDERRYFSPDHSQPLVFNYKDKKIAVLICEDIWEDFVEEKHFKYESDPLDQLEEEKVDLLVNISASPYYVGKEKIRQQVLQRAVKKLNCPMVYVNLVGGNDEILFDGESTVVSAQGEIVQQSSKFTEGFSSFDLEKKSLSPIQTTYSEPVQILWQALCMGVKDFFTKTHQSKAIIGLSGGIDSALVLAIACEALGKENVTPIYMPSQYSAQISQEGAEDLCKNLGIALNTIAIDGLRTSFEQSLEQIFLGQQVNVTEENIQARIRGTLLMAYSNKFGGMVLNTSNKSELAVGYSTLYGDLIGGLSVIGDLYKHQVYDLARWCNKQQEIIPQVIIERAPSAELRQDQKDSDSLPHYDILDKVLYLYLEQLQSVKDIVDQGYDIEVVKKIVGLVNGSEFKRRQAPPIIKVSQKAFGIGRRHNIAIG
ncbi:MAG TPA: NAD+ synthase [Oligoflexia bacterium]|nr:NAD+ synthase [Oligoflexia bacterium]HMR24751.1 NAD+ synthase [Oligoflexia bacterium]